MRRICQPPSPYRLHQLALAVGLAMGLSNYTHAAPLSLAQVPQGNGGREPAPNLIITVDDSGSMGTTGMTALRNALTTSFSTTALPDDAIRLGFQAMWRCRGFGPSATHSTGGTCPENRVRPFSGAHRQGFNDWVNALAHGGWTPSHVVMRNAGEFMRTTGIWSPYAANPGVAETPLLACRKSFNIFMTDGEWNATNGNSRDANTDGYGNQDGTTLTLPDTAVYDTSAANTQTRIYRDDVGGGTQYNTFADLAFFYWATDLQPGIANSLRPIIRQTGSVNAGTAATPYDIQEYWNPRNNPATWQNLTTYTIGFGGGAALSNNVAPRWGGNTWSGGDYNALLRGDVTWGNPGEPNNYNDAKKKDLWHGALNSRGRYVSANNQAELTAAFSEIINQVLLDSSTPLTSIAATTQTARADTLAVVGGYNANNWSGELLGYAVQNNGTITTNVVWNGVAQLDAITNLASRRILTQNPEGTGPSGLPSADTSLGRGVLFDWASLTTAQQALLQGTDTAAIAQERLAYIRGDRTKEQAATPAGPYRNRASRLGDIVNSAPWFVSKPNLLYLQDGYPAFRASKATRMPMAYVGANDGMLHGFAIQTTLTSGVPTLIDGAEKLAYIPRGVIPKLGALTDPAYTHQYYVDGMPFSGDFHTGTAWQTALVGQLAGGGRGFFVLNVTTPENFATATGTALNDLVITDKTENFTPTATVGTMSAATWADVGHMYGAPTVDSANAAWAVQIARLNHKVSGRNRWAVLLGNGINSTNETASLLIQYLDGDREFVKLTADATVGGGNGLSHPQVVDLDSNGTADVVYAGDQKGRLWKFDLTDSSPSNWRVAFNGDPLFVARGEPPPATPSAVGVPQPITTAPTWAFNRITSGASTTHGINLMFATGRSITTLDPANLEVQTIYSVWDNTNIAYTVTSGERRVSLSGGTVVPDSTSGGRASLHARTQTASTTATAGTFMSTSADAFSYTGTVAKRGWYFNLPVAGERGLANSRILDKRLVAIPTIKPMVGSMTSSTVESCEPAANPNAYYMTVLDINSGLPYTQRPLFDVNNDGNFNTSDLVSNSNPSRVSTGADPMLFIPTKSGKFESNYKLVSSRPGNASAERSKSASVLDAPVRFNWRQLQ